MADIFISYSKDDRALTESLARDLEEAGYSVWWDARLVGGDEFNSKIKRQITDAKAAIIIWTPSSVESRWVQAEAKQADDEGKLIPVRLEQLPIKAIPLPFNTLHTELASNRIALVAALAKLGVLPQQPLRSSHAVARPASNRDSAPTRAANSSAALSNPVEIGQNAQSRPWLFILGLVAIFAAGFVYQSAGHIAGWTFGSMRSGIITTPLSLPQSDLKLFEQRISEAEQQTRIVTSVGNEPPAISTKSSSAPPTGNSKLHHAIAELEKQIEGTERKLALGKSAIKAWDEQSAQVDNMVSAHEKHAAACEESKQDLKRRAQSGTPEVHLLDAKLHIAQCDLERKRMRGMIASRESELSRLRITLDHVIENMNQLERQQTEQRERKKTLEQILHSEGPARKAIEEFVKHQIGK